MPGPSSPDGVAARVSSAPSCRAVVFMRSTVAGTLPVRRTASAWAASLPDAIIIESKTWRIVYCPPAPIPTRVPSWSASSWVPVIVSSRGRRCATSSPVSVFISDAGRSRACGLRAASTSPESRSART